MSTFTERFRASRALRGIERLGLSKKTGLANSAICAYENGDRCPSSETLVKLATALEVTSDYLIGLSDAPTERRQDPICARVGELDEHDRIVVEHVIKSLLMKREAAQ